MSAALAVGPRTAVWLRQVWPHDTAKHAARAFGVALITAKGWCRGNRPANEHYDAMIAKWGRAYLAFTYPQFDWAEQLRIQVEIDAIQTRLDALREKAEPRDEQPPNDAGGDLSVEGQQTGTSRDDLATPGRETDEIPS